MKDSRIFVGITSGTKANMLDWLINKCVEDPNSYKNLHASVIKHGKREHSYQRHNIFYEDKKSGEEAVFKMQTNIFNKGLLLNDNIVNPETYECEHCQKVLKLEYKAIHDEKYCSKITIDFLNELLN